MQISNYNPYWSMDGSELWLGSRNSAMPIPRSISSVVT